MRTVTTAAAMQRLGRRWRREGVRVGFVPTMGYLHAGHVSLVHRARASVGRQGRVVVSVFVNPKQFGPDEDLERYPRDLPRDRRLCREAGVDALFVPPAREIYVGEGEETFSTYVVEERLSRGMEGNSRPGHFRGVTTVVAKLFNLVLPNVAVFGAKDWQQAAVVRRMVRDLNFPVRVVVAPIVRETDGLALSSRNRYLGVDERRQATGLWAAIREARARVRAAPSGIPAAGLRRRLAALLERQPAARVDYVEFIEPETLRPVKRVVRGTRLALAVWVGRTRLIDNGAL